MQHAEALRRDAGRLARGRERLDRRIDRLTLPQSEQLTLSFLVHDARKLFNELSVRDTYTDAIMRDAIEAFRPGLDGCRLAAGRRMSGRQGSLSVIGKRRKRVRGRGLETRAVLRN